MYENDITIHDDIDLNGNPIRVYEVDEIAQSATFIDPKLKYELVYNYMKKFDLMFDYNKQIKDLLMLGAAGFSYPKYIISHYEKVFVDVIDDDLNCLDISKKYFYLDDLIKEFDLDHNHRLNFYHKDAYEYLLDCNKQYDVIIDDLFNSIFPVFKLININSFKLLKSHLNDNGLLIFNMPGLTNYKKSKYLLNVLYTLKEVFKYVHLYNGFYDANVIGGNYIIIANDKHEGLDERIKYNLSLKKCRLLEDNDEIKAAKEFVEILK